MYHSYVAIAMYKNKQYTVNNTNNLKANNDVVTITEGTILTSTCGLVYIAIAIYPQ